MAKFVGNKLNECNGKSMVSSVKVIENKIIVQTIGNRRIIGICGLSQVKYHE